VTIDENEFIYRGSHYEKNNRSYLWIFHVAVFNLNWSEPFNMSRGINSTANEDHPMLTTDGKYMFFSRENQATLEIYWVDAKIIEELKPKEVK
jgi:hypothetical protein